MYHIALHGPSLAAASPVKKKKKKEKEKKKRKKKGGHSHPNAENITLGHFGPGIFYTLGSSKQGKNSKPSGHVNPCEETLFIHIFIWQKARAAPPPPTAPSKTVERGLGHDAPLHAEEWP